jgi:hypothetical protein
LRTRINNVSVRLLQRQPRQSRTSRNLRCLQSSPSHSR